MKTHLFARVWTTLITITHYFGFSSVDQYETSQHPLGLQHYDSIVSADATSKSPVFEPPGSNLDNFKCDYSAMPGWVDCTDIPGCWLRNPLNHTQNFTVYTDYENFKPTGIMRNYTLTVTDQNIMNRDGMNFTEGKLFNGVFPGPLLEACWGDTLNITVINKSKFNGTSIHWHGIRQNQTMPMDGVNGVTQCPIAPGDSFTYIWDAVQYGSSWYHSHYSVQYADGLQAPITIHGPTTMAYDNAVAPLLTSDWLHNSAFEAIYDFNTNSPTILLGGVGNCVRFYGNNTVPGCNSSSTPIPPGYELTFDGSASRVGPGAKRYLLRVINTSFSTSITFSIDNHYLWIVEADFVPVLPYKVETLLVAIGQRYHVIVEAKPTYGLDNPSTGEENFWIRTSGSGCFDDITGISGYERTGILRYVGAKKKEPYSLAWPGNCPTTCYDTLSTQLKPAFNWKVEAPSNSPKFGGEMLEVKGFNPGKDSPYALGHFALNRPNTTFTPFQTTYGNPSLLNLDNFDGDTDADREDWPAGWVVIPEDFNSTSFVYLVLVGQGHPIHLHGHDFAIVAYNLTHDFHPSSLHPPYENLMRRDVILLPATTKGYVVIAFKTDNPGSWLMHCHIALHASWGLSLQIMERQTAANAIWPPGNSATLMRARKTCAKWNSWAYDCRNAWPGLVDDTYPACNDGTELQSDSGI